MKIITCALAALIVLCFNQHLFAQVTVPDTGQENIRYQKDLASFTQGHLGDYEFPFVVEQARIKNNNGLADYVASVYIENYLLKLDDPQLYTNANIHFIWVNLKTSGSKAFRLFYDQQNRIDSIIRQPDAANSMIRHIVYSEEIAPFIKILQNENREPDWKTLYQIILLKYDGRLADHVVTESKPYWYSLVKNRSAYAHAVVQRVEKYGVFGLFGKDSQYNQIAWSIFLNTGNKNDLRKALAWSAESIKVVNSNLGVHMDTYANILYRLGRVKEAITMELQAVQKSPETKGIQENLKKMKDGLPTWEY